MSGRTILSTIVIPQLLEEQYGKDFYVDDIISVGCVLSQFFELFGAGMRIVKNDIDGNIKKISTSKLNYSNVDKKPTIRHMLRCERDNGVNKNDPSGTIGILWLKRTFDFTWALLNVLTNDEISQSSTTLSPYLKKAYERTLKRHHNWFMKKTFNGIVSLAAPYKVDFLQKSVIQGVMGVYEILDEMRKSCEELRSSLLTLHQILVSVDEEKEPENNIYLS